MKRQGNFWFSGPIFYRKQSLGAPFLCQHRYCRVSREQTRFRRKLGHEETRTGSHFCGTRFVLRPKPMIMIISRTTFFSQETCLKGRMRVYWDFQFRNDPIACLHYIFLEVESLKLYYPQELSVEAVPRHKNRPKDNFSCLNKKPVRYGIRYPVWFLRRDESKPVYCALVSVVEGK